jgi:GxxExxY protein
LQVIYDGVVVGDYITDLLVEECVILEIKTVREIDEIHMAQCLNYLKATGLDICLLINFYKPKVQIKRVIRGFNPAFERRKYENKHR